MGLVAGAALSLFCLTAIGANKAVKPPAAGTVIRLPLTLRPDSRSPIVTLFVRGRPVRFLVDTGASGSVVDTRLAEACRFKSCGQSEMQGFVSRRVPMPIVELDHLRLGPMAALAPHVGVLDLSWANRDSDREAGLDIAGILGSELLQRTNAVVDYGRRELVLRDPIDLNWERFVGEWRAVSRVRAGSATDPAGLSLTVTQGRVVVRTGRPDGVKVFAADFELYRNAVPGTYEMALIEHLDPPRKLWGGRIGNFRYSRTEPGFREVVGRYDFVAGRLVMTFPADASGRGLLDIPKQLASTLDGIDLVTFERVPNATR